MPALGSLLVEPIYVLTDTAVVGRLGTTELGGLALASTVLNTLVWVFNFLCYGTTVRVAVRGGGAIWPGRPADARPGAVAGARRSGIVDRGRASGLGARRLAGMVGDDPAVVGHGVTYLRVAVIGIPFQLVTVACIGYLYGLPNTRPPVPRARRLDHRRTWWWSWCWCSASTWASPGAPGARWWRRC